MTCYQTWLQKYRIALHSFTLQEISLQTAMQKQQAVRVATRYAPPLSSLRGRPSASRADEQTQRNSSFPRQYVLTVTAAPASRVKAAVSKAAW